MPVFFSLFRPGIHDSLQFYFHDFEAYNRKYWIIGCLQDGDRNFEDFIEVDNYDIWDPTTKLDRNLCTANSQVSIFSSWSLIVFLTAFSLLTS